MSDPASDLAQHLIVDATHRSPNLVTYLLTQSRDLPDEPRAAARALQSRWPDLTKEERSLGFIAARNVLLAIGRECTDAASRLDVLAGEVGRG